jgi:hypothetical protein
MVLLEIPKDLLLNRTVHQRQHRQDYRLLPYDPLHPDLSMSLLIQFALSVHLGHKILD